MNENPDKTPLYQPPHIATSDEAKPIVRMLNKMLKPKFKMPRGKGVQSDQNVHVKHKKVRFY